ncbi:MULTISPECIES: MFS transporter [Janthinobacterium]|uniref:MFS transporter n=1 Tax=Janthinobacterium TaxID=29580 RepID=UPI0015957111|nr:MULTISPECIES: MFS transporter [Janthinobacterium]MBR7636897.1 MFS transporter [Janthinobacterium lividum]QKY00837.1 TCR/Tet family MFS transporter [Janthinobacterium lividum]QKY06362.1 TCR/Tet family MFS transporter [Janthinobacterium lividum]
MTRPRLPPETAGTVLMRTVQGRPVQLFGFPLVFMTVLIDVLCAGLVAPVLPRLLLQLRDSPAQPVLWLGYLGMLFSLSQMFALPLLGALSDRFGRRPLLLLSNLGVAVYFFCLADTETLGQLVLGRILCGITASSFGIAYAFIADCSEGAARTRAFASMGAAYSMGLVAGPALGGWLGNIDVRLPFYLAGWLSLGNLLYGVLVLPESLPPDKRVPVSWRMSNPFGAVFELARRPELRFLTLAYLLVASAHWSISVAFVFYTQQRYGWDSTQVGLMLAVLAGWGGVAQMKCAPFLMTRYGPRRTAMLAYAGCCAGFLCLALSRQSAGAYLAIFLLGVGEMANPALQGLLTSAVSARQQGWLQGAVKSAGSLAGLATPALFAMLVAVDPASHDSGAAFVLAAILLLAACLAIAASKYSAGSKPA